MLFGKKKHQPPFVTAIIPAAGSSRRMGGGNKLLMELDGVPVLGRTLLALEACDIIREIIILRFFFRNRHHHLQISGPDVPHLQIRRA